MKRDAVVFYRSFAEAVKQLPEGNQLAALWAIIDYGLDGIEPTDGLAAAFYLMAKPQIDANNRRYENGRKGGRPKNQTETKPKPKHNQTITKPKPKEKEKEKDKYKTDLEIALDNFREHRKQLKAPMTEQAYKLLLNKLEKMAAGDDAKKIAILNQSIENGWKGVFELKRQKPPERNYDMKDLELTLLQTN